MAGQQQDEIKSTGDVPKATPVMPTLSEVDSLPSSPTSLASPTSPASPVSPACETKATEGPPGEKTKEKKKEAKKHADPYSTLRRVQVSMQVKNLTDLNEKDGTFRVRMHMYLSWLPDKKDLAAYEEWKAKGDEAEEKGDRFEEMWEPPWTPDLEPRNIIDLNEFELQPKNGQHFFFADLDGVKFVRCKYECDFVCTERFELFNFPVDCQDLGITFRGSKKCLFVAEARLKGSFCRVVRDYITLPEWEMFSFMVEFSRSSKAESRGGKQYPIMRLRFKMVRNWQFYFWQLVFPMVLLSSLSLTCFALSDPGDLGDRFAHLTTLLLAIVAFQYIIAEKLPPVPYLTLMDKYILMIFVMLWVLFMETAVVSLEAWRWLDWYCGYLATAAWAGCHMFVYKHALERQAEELQQVVMNSKELLDGGWEDKEEDLNLFHHEPLVQKWDTEQLVVYTSVDNGQPPVQRDEAMDARWRHRPSFSSSSWLPTSPKSFQKMFSSAHLLRDLPDDKKTS